MAWLTSVVVFVILQYISQSSGSSQSLPVQENYLEENELTSEDNVAPAVENHPTLIEPEEAGKFQRLSNYLTYMLVRPLPMTGLPLLYVEDYPLETPYQEDIDDLTGLDENFGADNQIIRQTPYKRSRYYRKYPWKRQNSRDAYEPENRYMCQPTKDDVFRLLVALHEARQGNRGHTIHFCNRKRPASAIFTNIRFLGKRK